jgi:hypothetical protein
MTSAGSLQQNPALSAKPPPVIASPLGKRLVEAEEAVRVVRRLDPPQTVVVGPVIGVRPVPQVGVWEVRVHTPGSPWMYQRPRARHPVAGGGALGRCGVGADLDQVLDQEAFAAVGEGGRVGRHAVVGAPHGRKSTSRDWPGANPWMRCSTSVAIVSAGSGRRKNSDLV